ncbi:hypothetical protein K1719_032019 [Acacia pycnantha]|nr:hypothetical protein K1719_032019 [Acacia pycnantha]
MAFNNMDIDTWKTLFDLCLEQIDRDVGDLIIEVQEEIEADRVYANIPDLNEPYDDGHGHNSIETPMNDDHSSNSNDSIETSEESSVLPQVVVSIESSGSGLPQDNVSVESFDNDTLRFETLDIDQKQKDSLNSISQKSGVGKEPEDIIQEVALEDDEERRRAYSYLHELLSSLYSSSKKESESDDDNNGDDSAKKESKSDDDNNGEDGSHDNNGDDSAKKESKSDDENNGEDGSHDNNGDDSTKKESKSDDENNGEDGSHDNNGDDSTKKESKGDDENNGEDGSHDNNGGDDCAKKESKSNDENNGEDDSQDNLHESNEQNDSLRFEKLDIDQKQKYCLDIYQQLEGASMEADDIDDIIQEPRIIKVPSILGMDIELLEEEILNPVEQRLENLSKLVHDIEKEVLSHSLSLHYS